MMAVAGVNSAANGLTGPTDLTVPSRLNGVPGKYPSIRPIHDEMFCVPEWALGAGQVHGVGLIRWPSFRRRAHAKTPIP